MNSRFLLQALAVAALGVASCRTVDPPAADGTPPVVKMDIYGIVEPGATYISFADCCTLRRTVGRGDQLTLVASAEDGDSGITSVEIVATVISECMVTRSFPASRGAPDGPPVGRRILRETERVLGSAIATASPLPRTRLVNATARLGDLEPQPCGPIKFFVNDDPPTSVTIAEQATTFCGVRVFARGKNGAGGTKSTATGLLVEGRPQSSSFPCASVPF